MILKIFVQFLLNLLKFFYIKLTAHSCGCGEIGRHAGLRSQYLWCESSSLSVRTILLFLVVNMITSQTIQNSIQEKLTSAFSPSHLEITNESHMHGVPKGSETHFKIQIVSASFCGKKLLERHRMVNQVLAEEIHQIRASALHTLTPEEWEKNQGQSFDSPRCAGGSKKE